MKKNKKLLLLLLPLMMIPVNVKADHTYSGLNSGDTWGQKVGGCSTAQAAYCTWMNSTFTLSRVRIVLKNGDGTFANLSANNKDVDFYVYNGNLDSTVIKDYGAYKKDYWPTNIDGYKDLNSKLLIKENMMDLIKTVNPNLYSFLEKLLNDEDKKIVSKGLGTGIGIRVIVEPVYELKGTGNVSSVPETQIRFGTLREIYSTTTIDNNRRLGSALHVDISDLYYQSSDCQKDIYNSSTMTDLTGLGCGLAVFAPFDQSTGDTKEPNSCEKVKTINGCTNAIYQDPSLSCIFDVLKNPKSENYSSYVKKYLQSTTNPYCSVVCRKEIAIKLPESTGIKEVIQGSYMLLGKDSASDAFNGIGVGLGPVNVEIKNECQVVGKYNNNKFSESLDYESFRQAANSIASTVKTAGDNYQAALNDKRALENLNKTEDITGVCQSIKTYAVCNFDSSKETYATDLTTYATDIALAVEKFKDLKDETKKKYGNDAASYAYKTVSCDKYQSINTTTKQINKNVYTDCNFINYSQGNSISAKNYSHFSYEDYDASTNASLKKKLGEAINNSVLIYGSGIKYEDDYNNKKNTLNSVVGSWNNCTSGILDYSTPDYTSEIKLTYENGTYYSYDKMPLNSVKYTSSIPIKQNKSKSTTTTHTFNYDNNYQKGSIKATGINVTSSIKTDIINYNYGGPDISNTNTYKYLAYGSNIYFNEKNKKQYKSNYINLGIGVLPVHFSTPYGREYSYTLNIGGTVITENFISSKDKKKGKNTIDATCHYKVSCEKHIYETQDDCVAYKNKNICASETSGEPKLCGVGGNINIIYRTISLRTGEAFPGIDGSGRTPGANWNSEGNTLVNTYIYNNRGVSEYEVYNLKPMYEITLNAVNMKQIRKYNKKANSTIGKSNIPNSSKKGIMGYADFNISMKCDGNKCTSAFLRGTDNYKTNASIKVSGCGLKKANNCGNTKAWNMVK